MLMAVQLFALDQDNSSFKVKSLFQQTWNVFTKIGRSEAIVVACLDGTRQHRLTRSYYERTRVVETCRMQEVEL